MDDSANHSTPTIRHYVKQEMKKREIEMEVTKQAIVEKQDGSNTEEKKEVVITSVPLPEINQGIQENSLSHSPVKTENNIKEENPTL